MDLPCCRKRVNTVYRMEVNMANLKTNNPQQAFYGAMAEIGRAVGRPDMADRTWELAMNAIYDETRDEIGEQPHYVREFLDGEWGQAFALCVVSKFPAGPMPSTLSDCQLRECVNKAVAHWQAWKMEPKDYRDFGVPQPMRYLDALVFSAGYYAEDMEEEVC